MQVLYVKADGCLDLQHFNHLEVKVTEISGENNFKDFRKFIGCDIIEHYEIEINGEFFDLWLDEEGKLRSDRDPAIALPYNDILVGNFVITQSKDGEIVGIKNEHIEMIQNWVDNSRAEMMNRLFKITLR